MRQWGFYVIYVSGKAWWEEEVAFPARYPPLAWEPNFDSRRKKKFWQCEHFYFPRRRLSPFSAFHWESSRFLRVCFRILLGQAWSALRNDRTGMVPSFLGEEPPGRAACSPNESLTISGSACSQTPKVNFCLSLPPPRSPLSHHPGTLRGFCGHYLFMPLCLFNSFCVCDSRNGGGGWGGVYRAAIVPTKVKADNYPLLAFSFLVVV